MTTKVTVDAHAGWPVEVVTLVGEPTSGFDPQLQITTIEPKTTRDFYIHSGCSIVSIREMTHSYQKSI